MSAESVTKIKTTDWHSCNIGERARYLLDHPDEEIPSDVSFLVGDGEREPRRIFKCHKFLLAMMSSMFQAMFYGTYPQSDDTAAIPDVTPTAFQHMLRFACGEKVEIDFGCLEDALDTLYCAKKYLIEKLELVRRDYLQLHIATLEFTSEICLVIQRAPQIEEDDLAALALASMSDSCCAPYTLEGDGFLRLSFDCLKRIVDYPHLNATEADIYRGVCRWVKHNVGVVRGNALREAFGSLLYSIRFPLFSALQLIRGPETDGILTSDEVSDIVHVNPAMPFLRTPRTPRPVSLFFLFRLVTVPARAGVELCGNEKNVLFIHGRPDLAPECCSFLHKLITGKFHIRFASNDNEHSGKTCPFPATVQEERNVLSHSIKSACWFEWDVEGDTVSNVRIGVGKKSRGCRGAVFGFSCYLNLETQQRIPFDAWEDQRIQGVAGFKLVDRCECIYCQRG